MIIRKQHGETYNCSADIEQLWIDATVFREAILATSAEVLPPTLRYFPRGSCHDAALLLGTFLVEKGHGCFDCVKARSNDPSDINSVLNTHAWLERDGLVVDIAADQFPECRKPVLVEKESTFHKKFAVTERHEADFRKYWDRDPGARGMLEYIYTKVKDTSAGILARRVGSPVDPGPGSSL